MIVQGDQSRSWEFAFLRDEYIGWHANVRRGIEDDLFPDVISFVEFLDDLRTRVAFRRCIMQKLQKFSARLPLPGRHIFELVVQERQRKIRFAGLAVNEGK